MSDNRGFIVSMRKMTVSTVGMLKHCGAFAQSSGVRKRAKSASPVSSRAPRTVLSSRKMKVTVVDELVGPAWRPRGQSRPHQSSLAESLMDWPRFHSSSL